MQASDNGDLSSVAVTKVEEMTQAQSGHGDRTRMAKMTRRVSATEQAPTGGNYLPCPTLINEKLEIKL